MRLEYPDMTAEEHELEQMRPASFAIAYRVSEAEDVVQEALLRVHHAIENGASDARAAREFQNAWKACQGDLWRASSAAGRPSAAAGSERLSVTAREQLPCAER
jgi:hypothetical protein